MAILITGIAGFVGVNLAQELLRHGQRIFGIDNLSRGTLENLTGLNGHANFAFAEVDITNLPNFRSTIRQFELTENITEIWHLAANSDIPAGFNDSTVDLKDTFMTTFNTLLVMKEFGIKSLAFASSSAIYGDHGDVPLVENLGPLLPISNYGAMKLASEAAISVAAESYLSSAFIFRFPNVIGIPATHGVMLDFVRKLKSKPRELDVLGNGSQQKGYLHVEELVDAMLFIRNHSQEKVSVYNIGADDEGVTVKFIAETTVKAVSPQAQIVYGEGNKGWVGDVPKFVYSIDKLKKLGWTPKLGSEQAVLKAIQQIVTQESLR